MKIVVSGYLNTMTKPQKIAGYIYLPMHIFILPLLLSMLAYFMSSEIDDLTINIVYYFTGFAFCLIAMFRYMRTAFDILLDNLPKVILSIVFSYVIYMMLNYLMAAVLLTVMGDQFMNPNSQTVADMASGGGIGPSIGLAVFLAPVVEEVLFRGVLFGALREKHRWLAYAVSIIAFGVYHIWQFALVYMDASMLIYIVQYIPAGFALARCYEQTNCIWAPIFMHMGINVIGMMALA